MLDLLDYSLVIIAGIATKLPCSSIRAGHAGSALSLVSQSTPDLVPW